MITSLVNDLAKMLQDAGFIESAHGIAMFMTRNKGNTNEEKILATFADKQPEPINWDNHNTTSVFLIIGSRPTTQTDDDVQAGAVLQVKKIPLKLIVSVTGDEYPFADQLSENIIGTLSFQTNRTLERKYNARNISMALITEENRPDAVWSQAYQNTDMRKPDNIKLFTLDFELTVEGRPQCWVEPCDGGLVTEDGKDLITEDDKQLVQ